MYLFVYKVNSRIYFLLNFFDNRTFRMLKAVTEELYSKNL